MLLSILLSEDDVKKRSLLYRAQHDPPPLPPTVSHTLQEDGKTMSIRLGNSNGLDNSNGAMKGVTLSLDIAHTTDGDVDEMGVVIEVDREDKDKSLIYTRTHTNTDQQQHDAIYDEHIPMDIDTHHHQHPPVYNAAAAAGGGVVRTTTDIEDIMDF